MPRTRLFWSPNEDLSDAIPTTPGQSEGEPHPEYHQHEFGPRGVRHSHRDGNRYHEHPVWLILLQVQTKSATVHDLFDSPDERQ